MKRFKVIVAIIFATTLYTADSFGQGCSDAGFCTIGNLASHKSDTTKATKHKFTIMLPTGVGDEDVVVFAPGVEYSLKLSPKFSLQGKLTGNYASGNLGSAAGLGDAFISGSYFFNPASKWKTSATLGTKLPLNQSNLKASGLSLPMQYQSSLGTIDLIAGFAVTNNHWQFATGWQQPLSGRNRNNFLPVYWSNRVEANKYSPSNDFNRKGDVLLRSAYSFAAGKKWNFTAGLLGIYHLDNDTYIDANIGNQPIAIKGSEGITLNVTALVNYQVNRRINIGISAGVPLVVRDVRPDGLTRSFVFAPEISFKF